MAGFFSEATRERIRAASDIVDVVGNYLPLKRAGANFVALCPFHKEKTPSFNVNPHLQIFRCFGCGKGGDVFKFVMEYESIDFPEAVKRLAERAKIPLEYENNPIEQQTRHLKEQLLQIHEQITQRWQNALSNEAAGQIARDYLAKRDVSSEAMRLFRLGYAPEQWDDTVNWAKSKGHELPMVEKAGLILKREQSEGYYDRFRGRLIFPICDEQGRVIGFSGRILTGDEKVAKYVNSPETPIFTKSKVFFGLDKTKRALLEAEYAIICEGQLDLIACFMAGVQNIVAPQGTAFTGEHARILKRYVDEVVLCFDSDEAGQNAAVRALDSLLASGLAVRVAVVPAPHDPDSFIKANGGPAFKQLIDRAEGFFDYYLNRLCALNEVTTDKGRLAVLRGMAEAVHKTGNGVLIDKYAQKTALRLGVTPDAVRTEFKKARKFKSAGRHTEGESGSQEATAPETLASDVLPILELIFLKFLLETDDYVEWAVKHFDPGWLDHHLARDVVKRRFELHRSGQWNGIPAFLGEFEEGQTLITGILVQPLVTNMDGTNITRTKSLPNPLQQLTDLAIRLRNQSLDRRLAALLQRTSQPTTTQEEGIQIMREQNELRLLKRKPLEPRLEMVEVDGGG